MRTTRYGTLAAAIALAAGAAAGGSWLAQGAWIGAGFYAKQLCSGVFVSTQPPHAVVQAEIEPHLPPIVHRHVQWTIERPEGVVRARWLGVVEREATYRAGEGCTLRYASGASRVAGRGGAQASEGSQTQAESLAPAALEPRAQARHASRRASEAMTGFGNDAALRPAVLRGAARNKLDAVVDEAFREPQPGAPDTTRAVVVVHHGEIVAERYAPGFDRTTRFAGWSLSKAVLNALVGTLVQHGRLSPEMPVPLAQWRVPGDARARITYDHLLRMTSGLEFDENYQSPFSDVARMLYAATDMGAYAASRRLFATPGTLWSYSSGSSSVVALALAHYQQPGLAHADMPRRLLFEPLGMTSALVERDAAGHPELSASVYASARDWARLGALFAADGVWNGARLLPRGWLDYIRKPSDAAGRYGAHFWLFDAAERDRVRQATGVPLPDDGFFAEGFGGQRITIFPDEGLVVVRLGHAPEPADFDQSVFAARVLAAVAGFDTLRQVRTAAADSRG